MTTAGTIAIGIALLAGYILGSISNAVWISRMHGVDILTAGSGNPGATNVKRVLGSKPGNLVFFLDLLKGFVATFWPFIPALQSALSISVQPQWMALAGLTGALLGHSFSVFIGFRGGKGVATAMGGLLAIMPAVVLAAVGVWVFVFYAFRYVSLASLAFAVSLPALTFLAWKLAWALPRETGALEFGIAIGVCLLITIRHRSNIRRLINGTESKFAKKSATTQA